jgi:hypothetical protein
MHQVAGDTELSIRTYGFKLRGLVSGQVYPLHQTKWHSLLWPWLCGACSGREQGYEPSATMLQSCTSLMQETLYWQGYCVCYSSFVQCTTSLLQHTRSSKDCSCALSRNRLHTFFSLNLHGSPVPTVIPPSLQDQVFNNDLPSSSLIWTRQWLTTLAFAWSQPHTRHMPQPRGDTLASANASE